MAELEALRLQTLWHHLLPLEHHLGAITKQQLQQGARHGQQAGAPQATA